MALEGLHHVTCITADAPGTVRFYAGLLGLRFVKKTVNYDQPDVYHLYFGDEQGAPGSILTFFEFPGAAPGRAGDGAVHRLLWRVGGAESLDFWAARLQAAGIASLREQGLRFADPEGLEHELLLDSEPDAPLVAQADDVPPEHALRGFHGVRAYASRPARSARLLEEGLGFASEGAGRWVAAGERRRALYATDSPPEAPDRQGAGSVHHVAWAASDDEAEMAVGARGRGARATPQIDRTYFRSVYFREPGGVLFELATNTPGFAVDEPAEHLGERLVLPPHLEGRRPELEARLTPLENPRLS